MTVIQFPLAGVLDMSPQQLRREHSRAGISDERMVAELRAISQAYRELAAKIELLALRDPDGPEAA